MPLERPKKTSRCGLGSLTRRPEHQEVHAATLNEACRVALLLRAGEASVCAQFEVPYAELPQENMLQSAALDKGYDANRIREILTLDGIGPVIPGRSNRREVIIYDRVKYAKRNVAERFFNKLKQFRRIATRFEKYAHTLLAMTHIVAAFIFARNS